MEISYVNQKEITTHLETSGRITISETEKLHETLCSTPVLKSLISKMENILII